MSFHIPTIDIGAWVHGGADRDRDRTAASVDSALREFTVARVTGHGIPASIAEGFTAAAEEFFALDIEAKRALEVDAGFNRGYSAASTEALGASLGIQGSTRDYFEAFAVGITSADYPHARPTGPEYAANVWPDIPDFRRRVDLYFDEVGRVSRTLDEVLGRALGFGHGEFTRLTDHSVDTLRINHYDEGNRLPGAIGMGPHTDYGLTTMAWLDPLPGLQIAGHDRHWHDVMPAEGALLVFVGDLLARLSNDRWLATLHRVVQPVGEYGVQRRRSAMFFHDGNADAVIGPQAAPGMSAKRPPIAVADHLAAKHAGSRTGVPYRCAANELARLPD